MTKSKPYSRNSARRGLLLKLILVALILSGCTSSTQPTFLRENIEDAIQDICKNEYKLDLKAKLVGETMWIYLPVENILVPADKPEKYVDKFEVEANTAAFKDDTLKVDYLIKSIPEKEKFQEYSYNKEVLEKINNVWKVVRRVLFSMERSKRSEPVFFCLVVADIKNGIEMKEIFYYLDMKKVSYGFISWGEYQHRAISETEVSEAAIQDKVGSHLLYKNITLKEFLTRQIQHRVKLKFQKPEVEKDADIDKEILKIIAYTVKTYDFKDFTAAELNNLLTNNRVILNEAALRARSTE